MISTRHAGKPKLQSFGDLVVVMCPHNHVVATYKADEWAHSAMESSLKRADFIVECSGSIA